MKNTTPIVPGNVACGFKRLRDLVLASVLAAACFAPVGSLAQSDDFNDGDDIDWLRLDPISMYFQATTGSPLPQNTWSVTDGKYRLQSAPTPDPRLGQGRVLSLRSEIYSSFHVSVDLVDWNPAKTNALALCARIGTPGPSTTRGYLFGYITGTNYLDLVRLQNEGTRGIPGVVQVPITLTPGRGYRMTFTGKGAELVGRLYELTDLSNPIAVLSGTDGTYADGVSGLAVFPLGASVLEAGDGTFDNFAAADRDLPKLTAKFGPFGEWLVIWSQFEGEGFALEGSPRLGPDAEWRDLSLSVFPDNENGTFFYDAAEQGGTHFFRLKKTPPLPQ
jgi:hypothetical protein